MGINPLELLLLLAWVSVPIVALYFVIRLAVRHGVMDAHRRLKSGEESASHDSPHPSVKAD